MRTAEGAIKVRLPQVRGAAEPYRSSLMSFLEGNSEVLDRLVTEMYARWLSTRDVEDAFRDATGTSRIWPHARGSTARNWQRRYSTTPDVSLPDRPASRTCRRRAVQP